MLDLFTSDESRLFYALLLNALVLWSAWRMARRMNASAFDAAGDAGLLFYLAQYLSVCLPGLVGALHPLSIGAVAVLLSGAMALYGLGRTKTLAAPLHAGQEPHAVLDYRDGAADRPRWRDARPTVIVVASAAFVIGYTLLLIVYERALPVISNDAITYHLPAAVQWLQTGRLGIYEAWFYNPANSYSPLAGSAFIEWLLAPLGNDLLARFVQAGPLLLLFVAVMNVCRRVGAHAGVAALIAAAAVLARPLVGQTILAKDDLFVAAFFVLAVDGLTRERLSERFGPWRAGIALGLLLATKYTVLLSLPILLLMLGRGWSWRRGVIVFACVALLAGPWYVRNAMLTGNPIYPTRVTIAGVTLLPGMLSVHRSDILATASGAWQVFTGGYYGIPLILACIMIAGWICATVIWALSLTAASTRRVRSAAWTRRLNEEPRSPESASKEHAQRLTRTSTLGAAVGIAIFVTLAPYGEMRFAYPALLLMFVATGIAVTRLPRIAQTPLATIVLIISAATAFKFVWAKDFIIAGAVAGVIAAVVVVTIQRRPVAAKIFSVLAIAGFIGGMMYGYVNWKAYTQQVQIDSTAAWSMPPPDQYGDMGLVWQYVRDAVPKGATIAYANTYFTYPLMGFAYDRRVVYAPTRKDLERFVDMPRVEGSISGEQIVGKVVEMLRQNPDREHWLRGLRLRGAEYLVVGKKLAETKTEGAPPEMRFAAQDPRTFQRVFDNDAGSVFQIRW